MAAVLVVGMAIAVAVYVSVGGGSRRVGGDLVKLEIRAKPVATIRFRGRELGRTPLVIQVPRSTEPVELEATFTIHELDPTTGARRIRRESQTKTVVPDAEQSVDFAQPIERQRR